MKKFTTPLICLFLVLIILLFAYNNKTTIRKIQNAISEAYYSDLCFDSGVCKEGYKVGLTKDDTFIVNKENCIKRGFDWDDKEKLCYIPWN